MFRFSIVTPNLNQGQYILRNLESVSRQTYEPIEHIVLDCHSSDSSYEILRSFNHRKRFLFVQDSDRGQSDAINKGFCLATGDILGWLNADDQYSSKKVVQRVAEAFEANPAIDVVYGRGNYVNPDTQEKRAAWIQTNPDSLRRSLASSVGIIQPSVFFKRSLLKKVGYLDECNHHSMDYDFWIRLALSGSRFHFLDMSIADALLHEDAKSVASRTTQLEETIQVCARHFGFAHPRWITAYARSVVLGETAFLEADRQSINSEAKEQIESIEYEYFLRYNASPEAAAALRHNDAEASKDYLTQHLPDQHEVDGTQAPNQTLAREETSDVSLYPEFDNLQDLKAQTQRLRWYLPESSGLIVRLFVTPALRVALQGQRHSISIPSNVSVAQRPDADDEYNRILSTSRTFGVWQDFGKNSPRCARASDARVLNLDKHHESRREAFQSSVLLHDLDWQYRRDLGKAAGVFAAKVFKRFPISEKAYLFCTGPSVSEAIGHDFSDGYRIVCNSIVTNHQLMDSIQPQFIVAADPVFHFGASEYSYAFREKLRFALEKYGAFLLVPFFYYPLIARSCPDLLEHTIGLSQDPQRDFNFNLRENLVVRGSDNILTLIMIPLGTTLARNLFVLGCDGRKPEENYFWKHDPASQFNALMQSAKRHHPAFFDHVDYSNYYDEHCENLSNMVSALEAQGHSLNSLTRSYIPCLAERRLTF